MGAGYAGREGCPLPCRCQIRILGVNVEARFLPRSFEITAGCSEEAEETSQKPLMETSSGAEAVLRYLASYGIHICFANPGTTEAHFMGAFDRVQDIRPVLCLHENVATGAADGFARMRQQPALTLLHLGPGLANGLANLHNARRAGSAVLNLIGDMASWHSKHDPLLDSDIQRLATAVGATYKSISSRETVVADTSEATHQLLIDSANSTRCTPVVLTLPHDFGWELGPAMSPVEKLTSTLAGDTRPTSTSCKRMMPVSTRVHIIVRSGWISQALSVCLGVGGPQVGRYVDECSEALSQAARGKAAILLGGSALLASGVPQGTQIHYSLSLTRSDCMNQRIHRRKKDFLMNQSVDHNTNFSLTDSQQ